MTVEEAEAYVYQSYLRAEKHQPYGARDSEKRRPDLTRGLIRRFSGTPCAVITGSKGKGSAASAKEHHHDDYYLYEASASETASAAASAAEGASTAVIAATVVSAAEAAASETASGASAESASGR